MECSVTHAEFFGVVGGLVTSWKQARSHCDRLLERQVDAFIASRRGDSSRQADVDRLEEEIAHRNADGDRSADALELIAKGLAPRLSDWSDVQVVSALTGDPSELSRIKDAVTHDVSGDQLWIILDRLRDRYSEVLQTADLADSEVEKAVQTLSGRNAPRIDHVRLLRINLAVLWRDHVRDNLQKYFPDRRKFTEKCVFEWLRINRQDVFDELVVSKVEDLHNLLECRRLSLLRARKIGRSLVSPYMVVPPELCPPNA